MFREKLAWIIGTGTGYSWFCLSFFVLLFPCVTHSSCSLPTCLCFSEKRNKLRLFCGAQVFFFPLLLSSVTRTSRSLPACLRLTEKRWKIAPVLQIQASSMKLRVHGFLFLVFSVSKRMVKTKFFYYHINIQIRRFFSELVKSESCGKYRLIIIRIGTNTA